jgi:hypothetical protein
MTNETRDPIFQSLDDLAGLADHSSPTDRMSGITRRARTNRHRKVGAGVAGLAVLAAGTVGVLQLLPGDDSSSAPGIATEGPPTPPPADGLAIDLTVDPIDSTTLDVTYRIHGTATAWSDSETHKPFDISGPAYTGVLLDRQNVGGSDGGEMDCRPGAPLVPYDETWGGTAKNSLPMQVEVPGPGTYEITVEAPYCGADGKIVPNETSTIVVVD